MVGGCAAAVCACVCYWVCPAPQTLLVVVGTLFRERDIFILVGEKIRLTRVKSVSRPWLYLPTLYSILSVPHLLQLPDLPSM